LDTLSCVNAGVAVVWQGEAGVPGQVSVTSATDSLPMFSNGGGVKKRE
jgi:hypothetical protein